jgi:hypothetical protein
MKEMKEKLAKDIFWPAHDFNNFSLYQCCRHQNMSKRESFDLFFCYFWSTKEIFLQVAKQTVNAILENKSTEKHKFPQNLRFFGLVRRVSLISSDFSSNIMSPKNIKQHTSVIHIFICSRPLFLPIAKLFLIVLSS